MISHERDNELPPPLPGMVWLHVAVMVPEPSEGGWNAVPFQERCAIYEAIKDALPPAFGPLPIRAVAQITAAEHAKRQAKYAPKESE